MKLSLESLETRETPSAAGPVLDDPLNPPTSPPAPPQPPAPSEPVNPTWG